MKKLLLSALMIGAFTASKAQTIDTNVANLTLLRYWLSLLK
jgi:hypothetical protein